MIFVLLHYKKGRRKGKYLHIISYGVVWNVILNSFQTIERYDEGSIWNGIHNLIISVLHVKSQAIILSLKLEFLIKKGSNYKIVKPLL